MTKMKALVLSQTGHPTSHFHLGEVEKPVPAKNEVLIKNVSTALNPVDYKMAHYSFMIHSLPIVLGCDVSGVVEAVGSDVTKFKIGDEVFAFTQLGTPGAGSFAEYSLAPEDLIFKKGKNMSFDSAATFPVGLLTAALGIFHHLKVPVISQKQQAKFASEYLLVWGGSSSVGSYAIQLGHLAGFKVIATCSKKHFDHIKSLGVEAVFDYTSPDVIEQIHNHTSGKLHYALDCIATNETLHQVFSSLSKEEKCWASGTSGSGTPIPSHIHYENINLGQIHLNEQRPIVSAYIQEFNGLIEDGTIKPNVVEKLPKGLLSVTEGFDLIMENKVGGKKVVVSIADTPSST